MGKPSAPPAPNYQQAATNQGTANVEAAQKTAILNNPNIISPYGNQKVTYSSSSVVNQKAYDDAMENWRNNQGQTDEYGNDISGPAPDIAQFTTTGDLQPTVTQTLTPEAQAALEAQQRVTRKLSELGESAAGTAQNIMGTPFKYEGPDVQTSLGGQEPLNYGPAMGMYGQAQGVNASPYSNLRTNLDLSGVAAMPVNAGTTGQQAILNRLQPQIAQRSAALTQQLANQGITPGSEAWNNAMREQQQQENDLISQAALQGIGLDMSANQQGYGQAMGAANLNNQALGQGFQQASEAQEMENRAIAQNYGQAGTSADLYNRAAGQKFNQNLSTKQFENEAALQDYQRKLAQYNQPLNQIVSLLSGAQIQTPQFQQYTGGGPIAAAPIFQASTNQGNYDTAAYNAKMNALGGLYSGVGGIAGGFLGGR